MNKQFTHHQIRPRGDKERNKLQDDDGNTHSQAHISWNFSKMFWGKIWALAWELDPWPPFLSFFFFFKLSPQQAL